MIPASQIKLIHSLRQKKYRDRHRLFAVEGEKMVRELLGHNVTTGHRPQRLFATAGYIEANKELLYSGGLDVTEVTEQELKKVSNLVTPQPVIALVSIPAPDPATEADYKGPVLAFESIRDPGNLGTILRTAGWFGISYVVCTPDSADLYNPKVVQATMGALFRVKVTYLDLEEWFTRPDIANRQILGTFLEGDNLYSVPLGKDPVILFGNESKGLSDRYNRYIGRRISIPSFAGGGFGPESLNVAAAVAVVCSELRRGNRVVPTQSGN